MLYVFLLIQQNNRGLLLLMLGNIDQAEAAFTTICDATTESVISPSWKDDATVYKRTALCLDEAKTTARARLAEVGDVRRELSKVPALHVEGNFAAVVECCDKILKVSPCHRPTLVNRADAKCELMKYDECYTDILKIHRCTHHTVLELHAHELAIFPVDQRKLVHWPSASNKELLCDSSAIVQFMLCLGPRLAETFITVLKNIELNRFYGTKMRAGIFSALEQLSQFLTGNFCCVCLQRPNFTTAFYI